MPGPADTRDDASRGWQTEPRLERRSGLLAEASSLVGRRPQIAAALDDMRASRVVTLTGPGGCGKTRLALRAATLPAQTWVLSPAWPGHPVMSAISLLTSRFRRCSAGLPWHG